MQKLFPQRDSSRANSRGFTLIELLIVITIIVILASLVIVSVSRARARARDAKRIADLSSIQLAVEMYKDKNGNYPVTYSGPPSGPPGAIASTGYGATGTMSWAILEGSTYLGNYLFPLPKDPLNGKTVPYEELPDSWINDGLYGYYYISDGTGYKLGARLEDDIDRMDNDGGLYPSASQLNKNYEVFTIDFSKV